MPVTRSKTPVSQLGHQGFPGIIEYVKYRNRGAFLRHPDSTGTANSQGAAGDNRHFVFQSVHVTSSCDMPFCYERVSTERDKAVLMCVNNFVGRKARG